jgi:ABC-type multidrug transport system ATPase subunit
MDVQVGNVSYAVNGKEVLHHISGTFYKGKVTIFMGPSGAGKVSNISRDLILSLTTPSPDNNHGFNGWKTSHWSEMWYHLL